MRTTSKFNKFFTNFLIINRKNNSILQMEIEPQISQVDFEIAITAFHDELLSKLQYFNSVQIELLRKFECNINLPQTHTQLVFYLRNMIKMIEEAFKDVQSYFQDLRMTYLYDYFRKIQVLMVNGFNFLSQALIIQIDGSQKERQSKTKTKEMDRIVVKQKAEPVKNLKEQAKEMEHYDYAINYYEKQEAKIAEEMHRMQDNIIMSKGLVEKLHPSKAVQQIQEIKQRAEITLENTEKIFQETYQLKYLEFKQYLFKLQKPEDIAKDFCNNLKVTMFDKFETGMKKSVNLLYSIKKQDELLKLVNTSVQTDLLQMPKIQKKPTTTSNKPGQKLQNLLLRQRKLTQKLLGELQVAKKDIQNLQTQRLRFQIMLRQSQGKAKQLSYNYEILSKIYDEKRQQINLLKRCIEKKDVIIERLKSLQLMFIRGPNHIDEIVQTQGLTILVDAEAQANMQENEIIVILKKTNEKMGEKIRQKEIRIKQIEKKQIIEKKQKLSRLRISQAIPPQIITNLKISNDDSHQFQSEKSFSSNEKIRNDRQRTSLMGFGERTSKDYSKLILKPSNFALKRFSNKDIINIDTSRQPEKRRESERSRQSVRKNSVRHATEISIQATMSKNVKMTSQKEIQVNFIYQNPISQERRTEDMRFVQELKSQDKNQEPKNRQYTAIESMSHRKQDKHFVKKTTSAVKNKKWQKQVSSESNRQEFSFSNQQQRLEPFAQSEQHKQEKQTIGLFQNLNIETQQTKLTLQKRSALSKKFLYNFKERQRSIEVDQKNRTCIGQFYKPRKNDENLETKHLICIDRIDLTKKQRRKYQKMSLNSKPSQKSIKVLQKQNSQKQFQTKMK